MPVDLSNCWVLVGCVVELSFERAPIVKATMFDRISAAPSRLFATNWRQIPVAKPCNRLFVTSKTLVICGPIPNNRVLDWIWPKSRFSIVIRVIRRPGPGVTKKAKTMNSSFVVNRNEFAAALGTLKRFVRRTDVEAILTFDDDRLSIDVNGITVRASGIGSLQGQAYVFWYSLLGLATIMPEGDSILIKVEAGYLMIGGTTMIRCTWQESILKLIEHPMDAPLLMTLRLKDKYTDEQLVRSA